MLPRIEKDRIDVNNTSWNFFVKKGKLPELWVCFMFVITGL